MNIMQILNFKKCISSDNRYAIFILFIDVKFINFRYHVLFQWATTLVKSR